MRGERLCPLFGLGELAAGSGGNGLLGLSGRVGNG
jgi:hypothetical protein